MSFCLGKNGLTKESEHDMNTEEGKIGVYVMSRKGAKIAKSANQRKIPTTDQGDDAKLQTGFAEDVQMPLVPHRVFQPEVGDNRLNEDLDRASSQNADGGRLKIGPGGRVVIPADIRLAMGVAEGDTLLATLVDGELRLLSAQSALKIARALVRASIPDTGRSILEDLWEDRRMQREREERLGRSS